MSAETLISSILFVPGWLATAKWWSAQRAAFGQTPVRMFDYPALTRRSQYAGTHSIDGYALHLRDEITALGHPLAVVGWSMGAGILLRMIELFGMLNIQALVLVDQTPRSLSDSQWAHGVRNLDLATRETTLRQLAEDFDEAIRPIIRANLATTPSQSLLDNLVSEAMKWEPELAASLIQDHWGQDYRPALEHVDVPTLIIGGGRSAFTPVAALQYMHERIQGSALSIFENSGHAPFAEHPQRFNQEVRRFLDRVD